MEDLQQIFWSSCKLWDAGAAEKLISKVDVNWKNNEENDQTALHIACIHNLDRAIQFMLDKITDGEEYYLKANTLRILLEDPRIDAGASDAHGRTPLWLACNEPNVVTVQILLASGKELNFTQKDEMNKITAIERAQKTEYRELIRQLQEYHQDPAATRRKLRRYLGIFTLLPTILTHSSRCQSQFCSPERMGNPGCSSFFHHYFCL